MKKLGKLLTAGLLALVLTLSSAVLVFAEAPLTIALSTESQANGVTMDTAMAKDSFQSILDEKGWDQTAAADGAQMTVNAEKQTSPGLAGQVMLSDWLDENDPDGNIVFQIGPQKLFAVFQVGVQVQVGTAVDENVTSAPVPFEITVPIPAEMQGKQGYKILEIRADEVNVITPAVGENTLTFPVARFKDTSSISSTTNTGVYAVAYTKVHQVTFDSKGGSSVEPVQTVHGEPIARPENPVKEGFSFEGWSTDETTYAAYDFASPVEADLVLYAFWTKAAPAVPSIPGGSSSGLRWDQLLSGSESVTAKANPATGGVSPLPALLLAGAALCAGVLTLSGGKHR